MSLDWAIYRALYRASECPVWQAESHVDPSRLARQVETTRGTVWRRLREWRRLGFIRGHEIIPHPALFGVGLMIYEVGLSNAKARQLFLDELELVDGVFVANFALGPRTMVISIADRPASQARRADLIRRIPGVVSVTPSRTVWLPPRPRPLTSKEWMLVSALRESPDRSFSELARAIGMSAKTFSRKYRELRRWNGILTYRVEDFSKFPGTIATLAVTVRREGESRSIAARIEERLSGLLELVFIDRPPYSPNSRLGYSTFVGSASSMEEAEAAIHELPGVVDVQTMFIGGERSYRGWFDERIHQMIQSAIA